MSIPFKKESAFHELTSIQINPDHTSDDVICVSTDEWALDVAPIVKILTTNIPNTSRILSVLEAFKRAVANEGDPISLTEVLAKSLVDNDPDLAKRLIRNYHGDKFQIFFKTINLDSEFDPLFYLIPSNNSRDEIDDLIKQVKAWTDAIVRYTNPKLRLSEDSLADITTYIHANYKIMNIILTKDEFVSETYTPNDDQDDNLAHNDEDITEI